ncbi:MAG: DUF2163 domain-containing protein [Pseudomonadota bacterium]
MSLEAHLTTGTTTVCRCWAVMRRDGVTLGFTDHDRALEFDGIEFRADTGMTAKAFELATGLSVDNGEAMGALSDPAITEEDISAGRYDKAEVFVWLVNWADVADRALQFRGTLGEIVRAGGAFQAELRGLAEPLNQPHGRIYQSRCPTVLGDERNGFDTATPGYFLEADVVSVVNNREVRVVDPGGYAETWFERGIVTVLTGDAAGLTALVKTDASEDGERVLGFIEALSVDLAPGDRIRVVAGYDGSVASSRDKFNNFNNFRGFPHIPREDWLMAYPTQGSINDGGKLT